MERHTERQRDGDRNGETVIDRQMDGHRDKHRDQETEEVEHLLNWSPAKIQNQWNQKKQSKISFKVKLKCREV